MYFEARNVGLSWGIEENEILYICLPFFRV
jgi:hypothetical protein